MKSKMGNKRKKWKWLLQTRQQLDELLLLLRADAREMDRKQHVDKFEMENWSDVRREKRTMQNREMKKQKTKL